MTGALIILAVTVAVGFILWLTSRFRPEKESDSQESATLPDSAPATDAATESCCGRHAVCERFDSMPPGPEYFDDEELDRFATREPDSYTPDEIEEFRAVLYTLLPADVYSWGVALTHRDIALPVQLRDEWMMLCSDAGHTSTPS